MRNRKTADPGDPGFETVKIGAQVWMARNFVPDDVNVGDDPYRNEAKYGRLLSLPEAKAAAPPGWHLPTRQEWEALNSYVSASENPQETLLRQFRLVLFKDSAHFWTGTFSSSGMTAFVASTSRASWHESNFEFDLRAENCTLHHHAARYVRD